MPIERIALKNFKCFKEVDISFSKITLLTGENSSGKSSLIYGVLAPLQSVNPHNNSFPLHLSLNGKYVNMGGFEEVAFNHNLYEKIEIDITIIIANGVNQFKTSWEFNKISQSPSLHYLKINNSEQQTEIEKQEDLSYAIKIHYKNPENHENFEFYDCDDSLNMLKLDLCQLDGFDDTNYSDIPTYIYEELIDEFNFISSFRSTPDRTYYQSIANNKVDKFGGGYIDQILDWNDNQSLKLYELIAILKDFKILHDIKPQRLSGGRFEMKVKVKNRSKWESLNDVGFGISQFLPVIVADLQLLYDSTLILSQPEIHLHPSVQANLGDYLVKQVKERRKNYIVETHSEYLLNRMRLLIVKG